MTKVSTITPCYNMGKYMKGFLDNLSTQTHKDLEIILDHNDPTDEEITLVEDYNKEHDNIFHIVVEGVDPIGVSMNRCIEFATGDYLCIWNVDDLRTPDSIEIMAKVLDENPDVDLVYGNYVIVPKFGETNGQFVDVEPHIHELKEGMILSNEPGYYKNNEYGIRIENLVYVKKIKKNLSFQNLTMAPIEKDLINFDLLTIDEKNYLFKYHLEVYSRISKYLNPNERSWLATFI